MARHIFIHFHDAGTAHDPSNGQFTAGGAGHALRSHATPEKANADFQARHQGIVAQGFKFERAEDDPVNNGTKNHYAHPDGSRAVITHGKDPLTGRHKVHSLINTMNQGKPKGKEVEKGVFVKDPGPGRIGQTIEEIKAGFAAKAAKPSKSLPNSTHDETAHDPSNGQFTGGSGSSGPNPKDHRDFRGKTYHVTSEESHFNGGGHRTKITHAGDPTHVAYLGSKVHKTKEDAIAHGHAGFLSHMTGGGSAHLK